MLNRNSLNCKTINKIPIPTVCDNPSTILNKKPNFIKIREDCIEKDE